MMNVLRVVLVDDNSKFLDSAARLLSSHPQVAVVGRANAGAEALRLAEEVRPDLMLVDFSMPGMSGLEITETIKTWPAPPRVIIVTLHNDPEYRAAAAASGADGFLAKSAFPAYALLLIAALLLEADWSNRYDD
jgi:DNA-binding NarL/FixJ family response regulator